MMPQELQSRSFRPYISSSISDPSFSSFTNNHSSDDPDPNPNSNTNPKSSFPSFPQSSSSRSLKHPRFSPSSFTHNARLAIALVPCAAFLLDLGGTPVVVTLTLGLMIAYIVDSLNFKSGAFFGVWFSLIAAQIAFFFSASLYYTLNSVPLSILAAFLCAETNFLIGAWASLQFKWIQIENPSIVLALERLLFACVPFAASTIFTWATVSAVGMNNGSYYLMAFNCVFYWVFAIPRVPLLKPNKKLSITVGKSLMII